MSTPDEKHDPDYESGAGKQSQWVVVGESISRTEAEFAVNGLRSYEIPAVLDASPGVFGTAGLALQSIYSGKVDTFKIKVPAEFEEEATGIVEMFLSKGDSNPEEYEDDADDRDES